MSTAEYEKREELISRLVKRYSTFCDGIILTGSMAYGKKESITQASDIDFLLVSKSIRKSLAEFIGPDQVERITRRRHFEAVCLSGQEDGVKISIHMVREESLRLVSLTYAGELRVYRNDGKEGIYKLRSFCGREYSYKIKNIKLSDGAGFRTLVPISFINNDCFYMGVYRDKLLSNPKVLLDNIGIKQAIDQNWRKTVKIYLSEKTRLGNQAVCFEKSLKGYDRFSDSTKVFIKDSLQFYSDRLSRKRMIQ